jgi:hypothetical protein
LLQYFYQHCLPALKKVKYTWFTIIENCKLIIENLIRPHRLAA